MPANPTAGSHPRFCSECGTTLNTGAKFCHNCGASIHGGRATASGGSMLLRWGMPALAFVALVVLSAVRFGTRATAPEPDGGVPLDAGAIRAPDISSMTPDERADRLFNRVMRLSSEGKADSAAFFGPMALGALEALPMDAHRRYDLGLVALVTGDAARAAAQADTILRQRPTHLLGLSLAVRAAAARGGQGAGREFQRRLLAAEAGEMARPLPEYTDHAADLRAAIAAARTP
jgi:hypothetical protein